VWQASQVASDAVWWPAGPGASRGSVAALTVSYNTRELTAFLLWSLCTILSWPELEVVVVDNGSRDGSAQLLAGAERGGACTLLANQGNRHHGPGLNQGISYLAARSGSRPEWIWILDSDVVAARPSDGGDPSLGLLVSAARLGIPMAPFPFTAAGHVIHRGRGSLAAVHAAGDRSHPCYEWAEDHHAPHFAAVPGADQRYHALLREFRQQTGPLTGASLAAACRRAPGWPLGHA
jgi:hypothetical protein